LGYKDTYKAIFDQVKTVLEGISNIETVQIAEKFRPAKLPMAVVNPTEGEFSKIGGTLGAKQLHNVLTFDVICLVRTTEPDDWFEDVLTITGAVVDAVLADRKLNNLVRDCWPILHSPGEIRTASKLYYGGIVRFAAELFYAP